MITCKSITYMSFLVSSINYDYSKN